MIKTNQPLPKLNFFSLIILSFFSVVLYTSCNTDKETDLNPITKNGIIRSDTLYIKDTADFLHPMMYVIEETPETTFVYYGKTSKHSNLSFIPFLKSNEYSYKIVTDTILLTLSNINTHYYYIENSNPESPKLLSGGSVMGISCTCKMATSYPIEKCKETVSEGPNPGQACIQCDPKGNCTECGTTTSSKSIKGSNGFILSAKNLVIQIL